jgi:adenine phosphoribosyltransferase
VHSITTGTPQTLWLMARTWTSSTHVCQDDVISTGSTLVGMRKLVEEAGGEVIAEAAVFTEGNDPDQWRHIISLGNLPVFLG